MSTPAPAMSSAEIRRRFLSHFESRGHLVVPSASLITDDPTLLLVNAGMVPFKPYFLGELPPPAARATSVQKCVRTLDIEEVGKTTRHGSFFQMAGNFSFGDYFKEGAIDFAWELLTGSVESGGYGLPEERLWTTVYLDDDEALELWKRYVPEERIQRRDMADNYWHMGVPGPGGPCSEIYYDRGSEHGREGGPVADEDRYLEVWNLVFMQYQLSTVRTKVDFDIAGPLPAQNIDTGMGLERVATVLQGVDNLYEIDTSRAILDRAAELTGVRYGQDHGGRRPAARRRRPRPDRRDDDRRRRARRQRGPRLRPAPYPAAHRPLDAAARRAGPDDGRARRGVDRRDGPAVPRARRRRRAHRRGGGRRGAQLPRDAHQGRVGLRHRGAGGPAVAAACCRGRRRSSCTTRTASRST